MNLTNWVSISNYTCGQVIALRLTDLHETCSDIVVIILGYIVPILAIFVIICNSIIIAVFMKPRMRSHTTVVLSLIACVDMLNIICPSASYVYYYSFNHYRDYIRYPFCKVAYFVGDTWVNMLNMISLWLTVMLAYIRSKCLKSPFDARSIHSGRRITICVSCIVTMAVLIHIPAYFLFGFYPIFDHNPLTNQTDVICGIKEADVTFHITICAGRKLHVLIESILDSILPCIVLGYYSISIYKTLKEAKHSRTSLRQLKRMSTKPKVDVTNGNNSLCLKSAHKPEISQNALAEKEDAILVKKDKDLPKCRRYFVDCRNISFRKLFQRNRGKFQKELSCNENAFEKLDRDSRRTSCIILILVSVIILHEIPLSLISIYVLITHSNVALPLSIYGCLHVVKLLGQYIIYPGIFMLYTCMSTAFRTEIRKMLPRFCHKQTTNMADSHKAFLSPCTIRRLTDNGDNFHDSSSDSNDEM